MRINKGLLLAGIAAIGLYLMSKKAQAAPVLIPDETVAPPPAGTAPSNTEPYSPTTPTTSNPPVTPTDIVNLPPSVTVVLNPDGTVAVVQGLPGTVFNYNAAHTAVVAVGIVYPTEGPWINEPAHNLVISPYISWSELSSDDRYAIKSGVQPEGVGVLEYVFEIQSGFRQGFSINQIVAVLPY